MKQKIALVLPKDTYFESLLFGNYLILNFPCESDKKFKIPSDNSFEINDEECIIISKEDAIGCLRKHKDELENKIASLCNKRSILRLNLNNLDKNETAAIDSEIENLNINIASKLIRIDQFKDAIVNIEKRVNEFKNINIFAKYSDLKNK